MGKSDYSKAVEKATNKLSKAVKKAFRKNRFEDIELFTLKKKYPGRADLIKNSKEEEDYSLSCSKELADEVIRGASNIYKSAARFLVDDRYYYNFGVKVDYTRVFLEDKLLEIKAKATLVVNIRFGEKSA